MKLIVDRIEDKIVVCEKEDLSHIEIPASLLPEGCREGSVLVLQKDGTYLLDEKQTERRREEMFSLQERLFNKGK